MLIRIKAYITTSGFERKSSIKKKHKNVVSDVWPKKFFIVYRAHTLKVGAFPSKLKLFFDMVKDFIYTFSL